MRNGLFDEVITFRRSKIWKPFTETTVFAFYDFDAQLRYGQIMTDPVGTDDPDRIVFMVLWDELSYLHKEIFVCKLKKELCLDNTHVFNNRRIAVVFTKKGYLDDDFAVQNTRFLRHCKQKNVVLSSRRENTTFEAFDRMCEKRPVNEKESRILHAGLTLVNTMLNKPDILKKVTASDFITLRKPSSEAISTMPCFYYSHRRWTLSEIPLPDKEMIRRPHVPVNDSTMHEKLLHLDQRGTWLFELDIARYTTRIKLQLDDGRTAWRTGRDGYRLQISEDRGPEKFLVYHHLDSFENVQDIRDFLNAAMLKNNKRPELLAFLDTEALEMLQAYCADLGIPAEYNHDLFMMPSELTEDMYEYL